MWALKALYTTERNICSSDDFACTTHAVWFAFAVNI